MYLEHWEMNILPFENTPNPMVQRDKVIVNSLLAIQNVCPFGTNNITLQDCIKVFDEELPVNNFLEIINF